MDLLQREKAQRIALATAQQRDAANPECSVWVEASAGTGKTKVLSDRVLRLLLTGKAPGRILCLTYTKAAAVEMNTRIAGRLSRWAVAEESELEAELAWLLGKSADEVAALREIKAQARKLFAILLDTPGGMKIQTIHSFCQEILKRFPLEAKISPYFEVMDDRMAKEAIEDVRRRLLEKIEADPEGRTAQALAFITRQVSEFTFPKLMNSLTENRTKIARLLSSYENIEALIAATADNLGVNENDSRESRINGFFAATEREEVGRLAEAMAVGSEKDKANSLLLAQAIEQEDYELYHKIFLTEKNEARKTIATKKVLELFPYGSVVAAEEAERLLDYDNRLAAAALFESTRAVLYLADDLITGYNRYKKLHAKMDYEDLIVLTRQLLEMPGAADWVLYKLDGGIDDVLIDEAQDTSPDQWAIIKAITSEFFCGKERQSTVFAVGDRKQSIYSFQGADPAEFEKMRVYFGKAAAKSGYFKEVNLEVSFRSTAAVLDSVNQVFNYEKAKKGVAPEGEKVWHIPSRIGDGGRVELWPLIEAEEGENPDIWRTPVERRCAETTSSRLAKMIAEQIRKMVEEREILVSQNRPLRYRDFMILVQRRNAFVEEMVRACKNAGVNIAGVDKIRLSEQIAVQDLISVGKFLLLPTDDLTLAEILKSPLWGLTDDDLFDLCYNRGTLPLWVRLGENQKYSAVYQDLQTLLKMTDMVRPFELYSYLLNKLGGRKKIISRIGYEAEDGLDEFITLCLNFEQEHVPSLQSFIDWIEKDEVEIKRELEQSEIDAVRIMTVHGSKGLQAPIVILPDTVRVKAVRNEAGLLIDEVLYYPLKSGDFEVRCKAIKQKEKEASLEEYRRLLYVALTRAEERLCICGYRQKNKPSEDSWYSLCRESLSKIAEQGKDESLVYETAQEGEIKTAKEETREVLVRPQFAWMTENAPEEGPLARPLAPSKADEEDDVALVSPIGLLHKNRYRRGQLIHKLLQFLPETAVAKREELIGEFLAKNAPELNGEESDRIKNEVLRLINDVNYAELFGSHSQAEVPLMGVDEGRIISGQIDRLVVDEEKVLIVDFKTNRPAAKSLGEVPSGYRKQLSAYKKLIIQIYPGRRVETYILWTDTTQMMKIDV